MSGTIRTHETLTDSARCRLCSQALPPGANAAEPCPRCRASGPATLELPSSAPEAWKDTVKAPVVATAQFGKYQLVRELGRGGMGVVYEAFDTGLRRTVALKYMHAGAADSAEFRKDEERFLREARLCAGLPAHPNIVRVHEAGVIDGKRYLAMEYIPGRSHAAWRKTGAVPLRDQVRMLHDILLAVHHAHENGVIHRDLKPQNVIVDDRGAPHVLDFGLAKQAGKDLTLSLTASGMVLGTPSYMSPEQARGAKRVDRRTDVWSAGVMLYELLVGHPPYTGDSPLDVLMKVAKYEVVPPSQAAAAAKAPAPDRALENICLKALARRLEERYATAKDVALDLARWLQGEEVRVVVPKRRSRRKSGLWVLTGVSLLVAALALALGLRTPSVEEELRRGDALMKSHQYADAMAAYGKARAKDPSNASAEAGERAARENLKSERLDEARKRSEEKRSLEERLAEQKENVRRMEEDLRKKTSATGDVPAGELRALQEKLKAKEEEGRKLQEEVALRAAAEAEKQRAASAGLPAEEAWKNSVNLLPLTDPASGFATGTWTLTNGELRSDASTSASIQSTYEPPEEYDFRIDFTRLEGNSDVSQILSKNDRMFLWVLGCDTNRFAGFGMVNQRWLPDPGNPTSIRAEPILQNGRRHSSVVQVRADGMKVWLDGRRITDWKTDYQDLTLPSHLKLVPKALGLSTWASPTIFHRVEVLEVSGKGRSAPPPPPSFEKAVSVDAARLLPGLRGEYYRGKEFEQLAYRRTDRRIAFDWGPNPGWPRGSWDDFSIRWTGFLYAPRTGRYRVLVRYDDGIKLTVGGRTMLWDWKSQPEMTGLSTCDLEQGYHPLTLEYFERGGHAKVLVSVREATGAAGGDLFFHLPARLPVPAAAAAAEREKSVRVDFRTELDRKTGAGARLLEEAIREAEDPLRRYVLLQLARTLLTETQEFADAFRTADELSEGYDLKTAAVRLDTFRSCRRQNPGPLPLRALLTAGFDLVEDAVAEGEIDIGLAAAKEIDELSRGSSAAAAAAELLAELQELKAESDKALRAERGLPVRPLDADAALNLGRVLCFERKEWKRGSEMLTKVRDPGLRNLAKLESEGPATAAAQTALADAWAALGAKEKSSLQKRRCRARAVHWYERAESIADADAQTSIRRKMQELRSGAAVDLLGPTDPLLDRLAGDWKRVDGVLVSPLSASPVHAQIRLPLIPPDEYDLTLTIRRDALRPSDSAVTFDVALPGNHSRFALALGAPDVAANFLYLVDGELIHPEGSHWDERTLTVGREQTFVFRVRKSGLTVESDGTVALRWNDYSRLSLGWIWKSPQERGPQLGAWTSCAYRVLKLDLTPLSGRVRPLR